MNNKVFDFDEQMELGDLGEKLFKEEYKSISPVKSEDLNYDFNTSEGTVELKTDSYCMHRTKNFFMEKFSDNNNKNLGGPWRAFSHNVDYFVYLFVEQNTYFWFEPEKLCLFLDDYIKDLSYINVKNKGWTTVGYKIPREALKNVWIKKDSFYNE